MKKIGNLYKISKNEQKKIKNPKQMINPDQNIYINKFNIVLIIGMYLNMCNLHIFRIITVIFVWGTSVKYYFHQ